MYGNFDIILAPISRVVLSASPPPRAPLCDVPYLEPLLVGC